MALTNLHSWSEYAGNFGTEILFDDTNSLSGGGSVKLTTAAAAGIKSKTPIALDNGRAQLVECIVKHSSTNANARIYLTGLSVGIAKSLAPPHPTFFPSNAMIDTTNWHRLSYIWEPPAAARFVTLRAIKTAFSFDSLIDYYGIRPLPWSFRAHNTSATSIADASFTTVDFDTEDHDHGSNFASNVFTAPRDGPFRFDTAVEMAATLDASTVLVGRFTVNKGGTPAYHRFYQTDIVTTNGFQMASGGASILLSRGDTVEVEIYQNEGGANSTHTGTEYVWFSGTEVPLPPY